MIHVRPLSPEDSLAQITTLLHAAYAPLAAMGLNYTAADQSVETTRKRFAEGHGLLAFNGESLVGTIVVTPPLPDSPCEHFQRAHVASVHQFGVHPNAQGSGVGRALLDASAVWAQAQGFSELALDTAEPAHHLVALYARWGFAPVGHVQWQGKVYRSVVMSKTLL